MITGSKIKAARALAGMCQEELAAAADITRQTLGKIEAAGAEQVPGRACTLEALVAALAERGVAVVPNGVMLSWPVKPVGSPLVNPARAAALGTAELGTAAASRIHGCTERGRREYDEGAN